MFAAQTLFREQKCIARIVDVFSRTWNRRIIGRHRKKRVSYAKHPLRFSYVSRLRSNIHESVPEVSTTVENVDIVPKSGKTIPILARGGLLRHFSCGRLRFSPRRRTKSLKYGTTRLVGLSTPLEAKKKCCYGRCRRSSLSIHCATRDISWRSRRVLSWCTSHALERELGWMQALAWVYMKKLWPTRDPWCARLCPGH